MNLKYIPTEEDYINLQLFTIKQTPRIMKQLTAQKYIAYLFFAILVVYTTYKYNTKGITPPDAFLFFIMLFILFFPKFILWISIKKAKKTYNKIDKNAREVNLSLDSQELILSGKKGEFKMKTNDIIRFIEIQKYLFIEFQKESFLCIPKDKVPNIQTELKQYASEYTIPYTENLNWVSNFYSKKSKIE